MTPFHLTGRSWAPRWRATVGNRNHKATRASPWERGDLEMEEAAKDIEAQREQDDQGNARSPQEHESEPLAAEERVKREPTLELQMDRVGPPQRV
jgi:hypothetical protein